MQKLKPSRRSDEGTALVALFVIVIICGALAFSVLLPNISRHREAGANIARERAFQLAEAGIDWGIAEIRKSGGLPSTLTATGNPGGGTAGSFSLAFTAGNSNGRDDDGDGITDDADEAEIVEMVSTGRFGDSRRTIRMMMRRSVVAPSIISALQFNVENPILDIGGNALFISGFDHLIDQTEDLSRPARPAISAPTDPANLTAQIAAKNYNDVVGQGGSPSTGYADAIDLDNLVEQAKAAATTTLAPGTHSNLTLGSATIGGVEVAVCDGDLHLSGQFEGAGILVVDGDFKCTGQALWVGIIIVRGRAELTGGGQGKHVIGGLVIGEEFQSNTRTQTAKVTGNADLLYSSDAIELAQQRLGMMTVLSWQEVANP